MSCRLHSALLVGPLANLVLRNSDGLVIAVDAGLARCLRLKIRPDFAVGDWDSLKSETGTVKSARALLRKYPHVTLNQDKERSDLFYALRTAFSLGVRQILCTGFTGGRPDHHFATLLDLAEAASGKLGRVDSVEAQDEAASYYFLSRRTFPLKFATEKGQLISLFGLDPFTSGVFSSGLKYPWNGASPRGGSHGLSNIATGKHCRIEVARGKLLVIVPHRIPKDT